MKHILLIDDDQFMRDIVGTKLTQRNYSVDVTATAAEGLQSIEVKKPDLILLDLDLPDMNGVEVLKKLKATDAWKNIHVIIFSNNDDPTVMEKTRALGADDFFVKVYINIDDLCKHIEKVFA